MLDAQCVFRLRILGRFQPSYNLDQSPVNHSRHKLDKHSPIRLYTLVGDELLFDMLGLPHVSDVYIELCVEP